MMRSSLHTLGCAAALACAAVTAHAQLLQPAARAFGFQARLSGPGIPQNGTVDLAVSIYDADVGGVVVGGPYSLPESAIADGVVSETINDIQSSAFDGRKRWLGLSVNGGAELTPRVPLLATPYALRVDRVGSEELDNDVALGDGSAAGSLTLTDGQGQPTVTMLGEPAPGSPQVALTGGIVMRELRVTLGPQPGHVLTSDAQGNATWQPLPSAPGGWGLGGNAGTNPATDFIGTTDATALEVRVNDSRALRIEPQASSPNLIGGAAGNTAFVGVGGATVGGGGSAAGPNRVTDDYGLVSGGLNNQAGDGDGQTNSATYATIGGGRDNIAASQYATVGGGYDNQADGFLATIAGGTRNRATGVQTFIGSGFNNQASGQSAVIGGGANNVASTIHSTISGGSGNQVSDGYGAVGGGLNNHVSGIYGAVAGGQENAAGASSFVGGGFSNDATAIVASIAGGAGNSVTGAYGTIAGGGWGVPGQQSTSNRVTDDFGFVGGGADNQAGNSDGDPQTRTHAVAAGGESNAATGGWSSVGGGLNNVASGTFAVVPGGSGNEAAGFRSFAAGGNALALHANSFVWADAPAAPFSSVRAGEVAVRASGGVRFELPDADNPVEIRGADCHWFNTAGENVVQIGWFASSLVGGLITLDRNDKINFQAGVTGNPSHGRAAVYGDSPFFARAGMYVDDNDNGVLFADVKNFRAPNPEQRGTDIVYACVEGPEAAVYCRGTARLANGAASVELPSHFCNVAAEAGMTVQVTPLSADSQGLAVVSKRLDAIEVRELRQGRGSYEFDWEVKALRKGYEDYQVIRPSSEVASPERFGAAERDAAAEASP